MGKLQERFKESLRDAELTTWQRLDNDVQGTEYLNDQFKIQLPSLWCYCQFHQNIKKKMRGYWRVSVDDDATFVQEYEYYTY